MKISTMIKTLNVALIFISLLIFANLFLLFQATQERTAAVQKQIQFQELGNQLLDASDLLTNQVRGYVQFGEEFYYKDYLKEKNVTKTRENVVAKLKELKAPAKLVALAEKAKSDSDILAQMDAKAIKDVQANKLDDAREMVYGQYYTLQKALISGSLEQFKANLNKWSSEQAENANQRMMLFLYSTIGLIIFLVIVLVSVLYRLHRKMKPLQYLNKVANRVAGGDLTMEEMKMKASKDEVSQLGTSIQSMVANLRTLVKQVSETSEQVAASSEQLAASSEQSSKATEEVASTIQALAIGAEHQVQSVEQTSNLINGISSNIQQIVASSEQSLYSSSSAGEKAQEGNKTIVDSIKQMDSISQSVSELAEVIENLGEHSKEIGQIVEAISAIAGQTNLLALNAAIEAARAGESGKGFAVVADEVRKLAEQSAESAKKIADFILLIQGETTRAVQSMETTTTVVGKGKSLVNNAGATFNEIQEAIGEVTNQLASVSEAIQQIAADSEQIGHSIEDVNAVANEASVGVQNVTASAHEQLNSMEEITASASSLSKMADEMQNKIRKFIL